MERPRVTEEDFREAAFRVFDLTDQLMQATNDGRLYPDMKPGSRQESDGAETAPFQMSHNIQQLLNAAIEHIHATSAVVRRAGFLHNSPPFTLGRAALECAATAFWSSNPTTRN